MQILRRLLVAFVLTPALLLGSWPSSAHAEEIFQDPYEDGPRADTTGWCDMTFASAAGEVVDEVGSAVVEFLWWFFEIESDPPPVDVFEPEIVNPARCERAKRFDALRHERSAKLRQQGDDAALWQNRPSPDPVLDSQEVPPDFVVVGMGDSFASGEGNPAITTTANEDNINAVTWSTLTESDVAMSESDDPDLASFCHRSSAAGFASAMMEMRRQFPQVSIYWRNFACSGAESRHLWRDNYPTVSFGQSLQEAGMDFTGGSFIDSAVWYAVKYSRANQEPQIDQALSWLKSFDKGAPPVDATYMNIGGNDGFFGPVIGACVSWGCETTGAFASRWTSLAKTATTGGKVTRDVFPFPVPRQVTDYECMIPLGLLPTDGCAGWSPVPPGWPLPPTKRVNYQFLDMPEDNQELIDPLADPSKTPGAKPTCTDLDIVFDGCMSVGPGDPWSSLVDRYERLHDELTARLQPAQIYLAEVPDFTKSDDGVSFCGDSDPDYWTREEPADDAETIKHDPYGTMNEDYLLSNSEWQDWQSALTNVGNSLNTAIRTMADDQYLNPSGPLQPAKKWRLVSKGPRNDGGFFKAWQNKHGVCALDPYVNTFEDAEDSQAQDMGLTSAGAMHPNAFGQQDYAERILWSLQTQMVKKMTPSLSLAPVTQTSLTPAIGVTLGNRPALVRRVNLGWKTFNYPRDSYSRTDGDNRVRVQIRTTPVVASISASNLAQLRLSNSIGYKLDYAASQLLEVPGDQYATSVDLPVTTAGFQIQVRACGPKDPRRPVDDRLCGKWVTASQYLRGPADLVDAEALRRIARNERLSEVKVRKLVAPIVLSLQRPGFAQVRAGASAVRMVFGAPQARTDLLGLTPDSLKENALVGTIPWPKPAPVNGDASVPVLEREPAPADVEACGVPGEFAEEVAVRMGKVRRGDIRPTGWVLAQCLQQQAPPPCTTQRLPTSPTAKRSWAIVG